MRLHQKSGFGPPSFTQWHFLASLSTAAILLTTPGGIFAKPVLCIRGVVEVDLRNLRLDQGPHTPSMLSMHEAQNVKSEEI